MRTDTDVLLPVTGLIDGTAKCQHGVAFDRTQCSVYTDAVIRQRNVGITEEN